MIKKTSVKRKIKRIKKKQMNRTKEKKKDLDMIAVVTAMMTADLTEVENVQDDPEIHLVTDPVVIAHHTQVALNPDLGHLLGIILGLLDHIHINLVSPILHGIVQNLHDQDHLTKSEPSTVILTLKTVIDPDLPIVRTLVDIDMIPLHVLVLVPIPVLNPRVVQL